MGEITNYFFTALFAMMLGFMFSDFLKKRKSKKKSDETEEKTEDFYFFEEGERNPMLLRNGYGVTRDKNPTFAEQWVNIMNYCGESQTEDGYEEKFDEEYPE